MAIETRELKRMFSILLGIVGFGMVDEEIRTFILETTGLSAFTAGVVILAVAAYFFDLGR